MGQVQPGAIVNRSGPTVAYDLNGDIYVTDLNNHRVQVFHCGNSTSSFLRAWTVRNPFGIACWLDGTIFITECGNSRIYASSFDGRFIRRFGCHGIGIGQFKNPRGIACDSDGILYITDNGNNRVQVY